MIPIPDDISQRITAALHRGHKIEAIKRYREATHSGLAEAKAAVEQMEGGLRAQSPESFLRPAQPPAAAGLGCAIIVVAVAVIGLGVMMFLARHDGDKAAEQRCSHAFGVVMSLMLTLQASVILGNPQRLKLGYFLLVIALLLMAVSVRLILQP